MKRKFGNVGRAAALLAIALFAAGAGSILWAGADDASGRCLEKFQDALALAEFFWHDSPAILAGLTVYFLNQYEFCLRYLG